MRRKNNMFGLNNFGGSCWVNACLQGIFRLPEVIDRYTRETHDKENSIDSSLNKIWNSKGTEGLKDLFVASRTATMPAGQGIGDSNELLIHLCDKLPFLDELCRFKTAEQIKCPCGFSQVREDSATEYELHPAKMNTPITECITGSVQPELLEGWKCDKCSDAGKATKQQLIGSFPKVMIFRVTSQNSSLQYSSVLVMNSKKYYLLAVISHTGGHWFTYAREMPPGKPWYTLDDGRVKEHSQREFPMSQMTKVLIYYRLEE
uniref:USP domain-containing protein n=1 Tax=viral metagenome TaxID=1070528 RepID=A0A6C0JKI0_9ZZZZ